ncbi:MAG: acetoin dehydrogenase [Chloroflexi bacterium]|jgi:pyruvate/2-oxoglutarate/acetoin dehydrogenase E1 component|nr:acetoin dehydrogenase [Chloroflexota bacterium]
MSTPTEVAATEITYRDAIRTALAAELRADPAVVFLGEDIGGAGGSFKTSEGLLEEFGPDRVIDTPISENGFVGAALGMAVTGMRPVVEIMFVDFLPSAGDAMINEIPKFRFMSGGQATVPLVIRAIGGATGHFGTQHSATGESWFQQMPGLLVATAGSPASAYGLLRAAIRCNDPVLLIEHKGMFARKELVDLDAPLPEVGKAAILRSGGDVTIVATLLMVERALQAADMLAAEGIEAEVIDLRWVAPLDIATIRESILRTDRLVIAEEQVHAGGWGATLISLLAQEGLPENSIPRAVSMPNYPIAFSPPLEDAAVPSADRIAEAARAVVRE